MAMMPQPTVPDNPGEAIEPLPPKRRPGPGRSRPRAWNGAVLGSIISILHTGAPGGLSRRNRAAGVQSPAGGRHAGH